MLVGYATSVDGVRKPHCELTPAERARRAAEDLRRWRQTCSDEGRRAVRAEYDAALAAGIDSEGYWEAESALRHLDLYCSLGPSAYDGR